MTPRIEALEQDLGKIRAAIKDIEDRYVESTEDISEEDNAAITELFTRGDEVKAKLDAEVARASKANEYDLIHARANNLVAPASQVAAPVKDSLPQRLANIALNKLDNRDIGAVTPMHVRATLQTTSLAGTGQKLPVYTDELFRFVNSERSVINSFGGSKPAPDTPGAWNVFVETGVVPVAGHVEGADDIVSGVPTWGYDTVTPFEWATKLPITMEALKYINPSAMELWVRSAAEQIAIYTDAYVASKLRTAAASYGLVLSDNDNAATVENKILEAAAAVWTRSYSQPNYIWASIDVWRWLKGLRYTNASSNFGTGEPAFPAYGATNRNGTGSNGGNLFDGLVIMGLPVVVCPNFASSTFIVGNSRGGEVFEDELPTIESYNTATYSKEVAMAGRIATYFRSEYFVKFNDANSGATPNW